MTDNGNQMTDEKPRKQNYQDLEIYKRAHKLAVQIHKMTLEDLPKFEMFEQGSQIRRSSKSIVANLVEGFGRKRYAQELVRFLTYSLASCDETRAHLDLLFETSSLKNKENHRGLAEQYASLSKMIFNFRGAVSKNSKS